MRALIITTLLALIGCSPGDAPPPAPRDARNPPAVADAPLTPGPRDDAQDTPTPPRAHTEAPPSGPVLYTARRRPSHTFDLLTAPIAPGAVETASATLPATWHVTGAPRLVADPVTKASPTFSVLASTTKDDRYLLTVRNIGTRPARLIADVPCTGCP